MAHTHKSKKATKSSDDSDIERRGAKATKFPFSVEQEKYIKSFYPAWEAEILRVNPKLEGHNAEIQKWNMNKSVEFMTLDLFKPLITLEQPCKVWEQVCLTTIQTRILSDFLSGYPGQIHQLLQ